MITKIIQIGDIHIRNLRRSDEYKAQFDEFLNMCSKIVNENGVENTRIVVCGDVLHNKTEISPEGYTLATWFLRKLDDLCTTLVFAGNHDVNISNTNNRLDPLSVIFSLHNFNRVYYLDKELGYTSGSIADENVVWCLYSIFDKFMKPTGLTEMRNNQEYKNATFVGLYHGEVKSAKTDVGYVFENGLSTEYFNDVDFVLLGHVHKRQCINSNGVQLVYSGSLIQQDHGENVSGHGFVVWDVEDRTYECHDVPNSEHGFYTVTVNQEMDIDEDKEEFINL